MPSDMRHSEDFSLQFSYNREYKEDEQPGCDLSHPVQNSEEFIKLPKWKLNRTLCFLFFISLTCLGALVLMPVPMVQAATTAIWIGSLGLVGKLLNNREPPTLT